MKKLSQITFSLYLSLVLITEGFGFPNGHLLAFWLIVAGPFLLFFIPSLLSLFQSKTAPSTPLAFPQRLTVISLALLTYIAVTMFFSIQLQNAVETWLFSVSIFLLFIYIYNNKDMLLIPTMATLSIFSFLFVIYSLVLTTLGSSYLASFVPTDGYQFVYSTFGSHNQLGNFLLIPILFCLVMYCKEQKKIYLWIAILFLPIFIFAYSRSAYVGLSVGLLLLMVWVYATGKMKTHKLLFISIASLVFILGILLFSISTQAQQIPGFRAINAALQTNFRLTDKDLFNGRDIYTAEAVQAIQSAPLFGVGGGNVIYKFIEYWNSPINWPASSHNLELDFLIEYGLVGGVIGAILLGLIAMSLYGQWKRGDYIHMGICAIILAMVVTFQTDYTYTIYAYFLLLIMLLAFIYEEQTTFTLSPSVILAPQFLLVLISIFCLFSTLVRPLSATTAYYLYPINPALMRDYITEQQSLGNYKTAVDTAPLLGQFYRSDYPSQIYLGDFYNNTNDKKQALRYYLQAYGLNHFPSTQLVLKIYGLKKDVESSSSAREFFTSFLSMYQQNRSKFLFNTKLELKQFCRENLELSCVNEI